MQYFVKGYLIFHILIERVRSPKEHSASGPQPGVQELPPSEATSLEALLGLEESGGDQVVL